MNPYSMPFGCGVVYQYLPFLGKPWLESLKIWFHRTLDCVMSTEGSRWLGDVEGNFVMEMCQIKTDCLLNMTSKYRHQGGGVGDGCELKQRQLSSSAP